MQSASPRFVPRMAFHLPESWSSSMDLLIVADRQKERRKWRGWGGGGWREGGRGGEREEERMENYMGGFRARLKIYSHHSCSVSNCRELSHMTAPNCSRGREMQYSYVSRKQIQGLMNAKHCLRLKHTFLSCQPNFSSLYPHQQSMRIPISLYPQ